MLPPCVPRSLTVNAPSSQEHSDIGVLSGWECPEYAYKAVEWVKPLPGDGSRLINQGRLVVVIGNAFQGSRKHVRITQE